MEIGLVADYYQFLFPIFTDVPYGEKIASLQNIVQIVEIYSHQSVVSSGKENIISKLQPRYNIFKIHSFVAVKDQFIIVERQSLTFLWPC